MNSEITYPLERGERLIIPDTWNKMASQRSLGWNRVEEWLRRMYDLRDSLRNANSAWAQFPAER
jgi:hypothetical protein